jgi:hypothetical protein
MTSDQECRAFVTIPLVVGRMTHFCTRPAGHRGPHESPHQGPDGRLFVWQAGETIGPDV